MQQKIKGGNQFQLNQIHLGQWPLNSSVHMRVQGWNYSPNLNHDITAF